MNELGGGDLAKTYVLRGIRTQQAPVHPGQRAGRFGVYDGSMTDSAEIARLKAEAAQAAAEAAAAKTQFRDLIDDLFSETGKHLDRSSNELRFLQYDEPLSPYVLSSGEKQMLILLLTALVQDRQPGVFFMDEPEVSLHFDWQKRLISMVRALNPHGQIILTTHSPAVILDGWEDHVTEIEEITR